MNIGDTAINGVELGLDLKPAEKVGVDLITPTSTRRMTALDSD